ncbi:retron St85 family effector protein [Achromobacter sp.]|uniref:retron St85 family effector protein n=1 Tax=Achromobacter sp. TaxID=134375 RepID=UPI003D06664D
MQKTIKDLAQTIDISKCRIARSTRRVVVFGGKLANQHPLPHRGQFMAVLSLRHRAIDQICTTPEVYDDWKDFGMYQDLLTFEEDLCAFVDVILLFLDGVGACGECGAFIKDERTAKKLLVVMDERYFEEDSFIRLGLLFRLEHTHQNITLSVPKDLSNNDVDQIVDELEQRLGEAPLSEGLDLADTRHQLFIIADFVELIQVARRSDISTFLQELGVTLNTKRLSQLLYVLERFNIIKASRGLREQLYAPVPVGVHYVDYSLAAGRWDRARVKALLFKKTSEDKHRHQAFVRAKQAEVGVKDVAQV